MRAFKLMDWHKKNKKWTSKGKGHCRGCGHMELVINKDELCWLCWNRSRGNLAEIFSWNGKRITINVPKKCLRDVKDRLMKAGFVIKDAGVNY